MQFLKFGEFNRRNVSRMKRRNCVEVKNRVNDSELIGKVENVEHVESRE